MLRIQIERLQVPGVKCSHPDCKKNPQYFVNILGSVWHIKVDTPVAIVTMGGKEEIYCRACIDELYKFLKTKLDPKLWAFH